MESFPVPALLAGAFVIGAIVGYGIRAFISARRRTRARRYGFFLIEPPDRDRAAGKVKPIRPSPSGNPWTEADKKQLLEMVDAGKSEVEIGTVLNRTPRAVASHLRRLRKARNNPSGSRPEVDPHLVELGLRAKGK
jgi:hypothetical protein